MPLCSDGLLCAVAVADLSASGVPLATIASESGQLTELRGRVQSCRGWEGSSGSRTLALGVFKYLHQNVPGASNRPLAL